MSLNEVNNLPVSPDKGLAGHNEGHRIIHSALKELVDIVNVETPITIGEDYTRAIGVGSSTMAGMLTRFVTAFAAQGVTYVSNPTAGGSWQMSHISAATGARPLTVKEVVIPASGSVVVTPLNMNEANNSSSNMSWPGSLAGVNGVLSSPSSSAVFTFTRSESGAAVNVATGTQYIPSTPLEYSKAIALLNVGKNTLTTTRSGWDAQRTIDLTDAIVEKFGGAGGRALVIGQFNNTNHPADSTTRTKITQVNLAQKNSYGDRFFDLHEYLTGAQVWLDTALTPTAEDTTQQGLGNKPPSLSSDDGHMNGVAYLAVVNRIISRLQALGWLLTPPAPEPGTRTVIATENFNKADGTIYGQKTTTGDLTWVAPTDNPAGNFLNITGGRVQNSNATARRGSLPMTKADYRVTITLPDIAADPANQALRLTARIQNFSTYYFMSPRRSNVATGLSLWKSTGGSLTALKTNGDMLPVAGDRISIEVVGSTIRGYLNDNLAMEATDTDYASGGVGIEVLSAGITGDDLVIEVFN